jgi:beta-N-acetylhexosaminidase
MSQTAALRPVRPSHREDADALALELFVAGYDGISLPERYRERLEQGLAGIILFARNLQRTGGGERGDPIDVDALCAQTAAIHAAGAQSGALPTIVSVDQEGGLVARLRAPFFHAPPMRDVADHDDVELTQDVGAQTGAECLAAGFNLDFAPVLDIDTNPDNPIIGRRAFGATPEAVIRHAGAFLAGLQAEGVRGCGKHFPGHGDTDTDSHLALPRLPFDLERLEAVELRPFAALAREMGMIMTAHVLFPALDPKLPATLSPRILGPLLRERCGFEGVICSDDLEMQGVAGAFSMTERIRLGLDAGVDLFLVCRVEAGLDEAVREVSRALQQDDERGERVLDAIARVRHFRQGLRRPTPIRAAVEAAVGSERAARLRIRMGLGTV